MVCFHNMLLMQAILQILTDLLLSAVSLEHHSLPLCLTLQLNLQSHKPCWDTSSDPSDTALCADFSSLSAVW